MVGILLSFTYSVCIAQDKVQGVIVELSSGQKLEYRLTDNPRLQYNGNTINIIADGVNVQYTPSEIVKVKLAEVDGPKGESEDGPQTTQQGVIVELSNGERLEYSFTDNPKLQYNGQTITITSESLTVEYTPSEIAKVRFGEVEDIHNGVEENIAETQKSNICMDAGFIRLSGFNKEDVVRVYTMDGKQFATYKTNLDGNLLIPISTLPNGISILKIKQQTIKIARR